MTDLPPAVAELVDELAALPGATAVVLGGSRALAFVDASRDWDLGLYYRGTIELTALAARGTIHPPGSWGRLMNGGAWLRCEDHKALLRPFLIQPGSRPRPHSVGGSPERSVSTTHACWHHAVTLSARPVRRRRPWWNRPTPSSASAVSGSATRSS